MLNLAGAVPRAPDWINHVGRGAQHSQRLRSEVKVRGQRSRSEVRGQRSEVKVKVRGPKPNFLFRSSFDMKLRLTGVFFDALNRSAIDFYLGDIFGVKF